MRIRMRQMGKRVPGLLSKQGKERKPEKESVGILNRQIYGSYFAFAYICLVFLKIEFRRIVR